MSWRTKPRGPGEGPEGGSGSRAVVLDSVPAPSVDTHHVENGQHKPLSQGESTHSVKFNFPDDKNHEPAEDKTGKKKWWKKDKDKTQDDRAGEARTTPPPLVAMMDTRAASTGSTLPRTGSGYSVERARGSTPVGEEQQAWSTGPKKEDPFAGHHASVLQARSSHEKKSRRSSVVTWFTSPLRRTSGVTNKITTFLNDSRTVWDDRPEGEDVSPAEAARINLEIRKKIRDDEIFSEVVEFEMAAFRRVFDLFDTDRQGVVAANYLGTMMRVLGMNPTTSQIMDIELEVDVDKSKELEFPEFVHAMIRGKDLYRHDRDDILMAFKYYDDDGTGDISITDLRNIIVLSGEDLTTDEIDTVLVDADQSGDGRLDFFEFAKLMSSGGLLEFERRNAAALVIQRRFKLAKQREADRIQRLQKENAKTDPSAPKKGFFGRFGGKTTG